MNKRISYILISIIILSLLLRVYYLEKESLWLDEGHSVNISKGSISEIIYKADIDPNPPLYYIVLHFWMKLFGDSEFSIRLPSVIFGILSIYLVFKLGELIYNRDIGIICSFILSISQYHIRYSQEARAYSLLVLLVLLSNYYFIKVLKNEANKANKEIVGYIISSIMMIFTHIFGLFYLVFQNIYYIIFKKENIKFWLLVQSSILSFFILWSPFLLRRIENSIGTNNIVSNLQTIPTLKSVYGTFRIFVGSEEILYLFIAVIIIGLIIKLKEMQYDKEDTYKYIFMILWLFLPILASVIISYTIGPIYMNRYFIASFPALLLLFSKEIYDLKKISIIFLLILIVLQIPLIEKYYNDTDKEQWRDVANYIKDSKKDNDTILLYPKFVQIPFGYYYKENTDYIGISNFSDIKTVNNGDNEDRVWLILSHIKEYKERKRELKLIEGELSKTHIKKDSIKFTGIEIGLYAKS